MSKYMTMCFVYLIQCGDLSYYKIGISDRPEERLQGLQVANPQKLNLLMTCAFTDMAAARQAEKAIHLELRSDNIHSEWFELTSKQVDTLKCEMIKAGM